MAENKPAVVNAKEKAVVVPEAQVLTMTTEEYAEYSKANGRIMGRRPDQKTKCTTQELRVLINAGWTPQMVMEKHGMSEEEHRGLIYDLSKEERLDKPISYTASGYRRK